MANSDVVPDVPSTAIRVAVPSAVIDEVEQVGTRIGLARDELIELLLRSRLDGPDSPAARVWDLYATGRTQSPADVSARLEDHGIRDGVRGFRLGSPAPDRIPPPWTRPGTGAELWWTPMQAWPIARGLFRVDPSGVSVIAALRLGHVLGVYRVQGWAEDPDTGRRYALGGKVITADGRLLDAETGTDVGAASAADVTIHNVLTAAPIITPGRQPVVKLSTR